MARAGERVLVTGATGFIGRHLVPVLLEAGFALNVLSRSPGALPGSHAENLTIYRGDMRRPADLDPACRGCRAVINLAGIAHVGARDETALRAVNQQAPLDLFRAAEAQGVERLIHLSSSLAAEAESGRDRSLYAATKLAAERVLFGAAQSSPLALTLIRPVHVYGAGMGGNLAGLIRMIAGWRLPRLPRDGARISLVGVHDLSRAITLALRQPRAAGKTYTVTDGVDYPLSELEAAIYGQSGRKLPAWSVPPVILYAALSMASLLGKLGLIDTGITTRTYRNLVTDRIHSNTAAREELGFSPTTDFYRELPRILSAMEHVGSVETKRTDRPS